MENFDGKFMLLAHANFVYVFTACVIILAAGASPVPQVLGLIFMNVVALLAMFFLS